jgi:hypothetical protein
MQPGAGLNERVLVNLYNWAFVPFARSNRWLEGQHLTGLAAFFAGIVQRIRPDLGAAGWAGSAYAEELSTRARDYAASAAVELGRCLFKGPELENRRADALAPAGLPRVPRRWRTRSLIATDRPRCVLPDRTCASQFEVLPTVSRTCIALQSRYDSSVGYANVAGRMQAGMPYNFLAFMKRYQFGDN